MTTPTKYFHDRTILLLVTLNTILLVVGVLLVLFRLDSSKGNGYILQYRSGVGIGEFKSGTALDMSSFVFFLAVTYILSLLISVRMYNDRRSISLSILIMTGMLAVFAIIVSNALLVLR